MKAEFEIYGLLGSEGNYKVTIKRLSDNAVKDFNVTDSFVNTCKARSPSSVFQRFKDINGAVNWDTSTVDSDKLLQNIEVFNEDVRSASSGRMDNP